MSPPTPPAQEHDAAAGGRSSVVAAAILAGGQGRRLGGVNKSLLMVDGQRIIDRQLAVLRPLFERVVVVAGAAADADRWRSDDFGGAEVIHDRHSDRLGPLAGLDAAVAWLPAQCHSLLCVASDMPYLVPAVIKHLRDSGPADAAAVIPRLSRGAKLYPEPLCARYHRSVAGIVDAHLRRGRRAMHEFLDALTVAVPDPGGIVWLDEPELRRLDPTLATFWNVNTPRELANRPA